MLATAIETIKLELMYQILMEKLFTSLQGLDLEDLIIAQNHLPNHPKDVFVFVIVSIILPNLKLDDMF